MDVDAHVGGLAFVERDINGRRSFTRDRKGVVTRWTIQIKEGTRLGTSSFDAVEQYGGLLLRAEDGVAVNHEAPSVARKWREKIFGGEEASDCAGK